MALVVSDSGQPPAETADVGTYRAFAWANPRAFELLSMNLPLDWRASVEDTARATAPVLTLAERLVGREQALEAARLITAFANGFIAMELAGAFRLGGDVDGSYRYGVDAIIGALARDAAPRIAGDAPGSTSGPPSS